MMNWDLTGRWVVGEYKGISFCGTVLKSYLSNTIDMKHYVQLHDSFIIDGIEMTRIIVTDDHLISST
jgi:hypothetical protein